MKIWLTALLFIPTLVLAQDQGGSDIDPEAGQQPRVTSSGFTEVSIVPEPETPPEKEADPDAEDSIRGWEAAAPEAIEPEPATAVTEGGEPGPGDEPINWVDDSHAYATNQAQALTEWMDDFFGDPNYDLEKAESLLRLEFVSDWDQQHGSDFKVRLRGKVQLPKISRRLNLVFAGEDGNDLDEEERRDEDQIGLQYQVKEREKSRFDATIGYASGNLRPGVRYRFEDSTRDAASYRFTQRIQYEDGDGFYSTTQLENNWAIDEDSIIRWSNRAKWGEHTDGVEWRTKLALRERYNLDTNRPIAMSYYGTLKGVTRPDPDVKNYRLGVLFRRQIYRDFLFIELDPAFNYRRRQTDDGGFEHKPVWSIDVRLEIALERDLRRIRNKDSQVEG